MDLLRIVVKKRTEGSKAKTEDRESLSRFASRVAKLRGEGPMATSVEPEVALEVVSINICDIEIPSNYARKSIGQIDPLVASIKVYGIQQPLKVIKLRGTKKFRLVYGLRRLRAAEKAGLPAVPCIVELVTREDRLVMLSLAENLHRMGLSVIDQGACFQELQQKATMALNDIASNLGITTDLIREAVDLLALPEAVRAEVSSSPDRFTLGMLKILLQAFKKSKANGKKLFKAMLNGSVSNTKEAEALLAQM